MARVGLEGVNDPEDPLWRLAEQRIREAMDRGEFDDLPTAGKPLVLEEDGLVPEELRAAYRLLKNAGYVPQEVRLRREVREIGALLGSIESAGERLRAARRLDLLRMRLEGRGGRPALHLDPDYRDAVLERLDGGE